jgi:hypothetical protein
VQGENLLHNIVTVAEYTPDVLHWLPTREAVTVKAVLKEVGKFPENLVVRVSAALIDGQPPKGFPQTSIVVSDLQEATCPAPAQGGVCGECRKCWLPAEQTIAYALH